MTDYQVIRTVDRPDLDDQQRDWYRAVWPEFIFHDDTIKPYLQRVTEYFPNLDIEFLRSGLVLAGGWGVAFSWNETLEDLPSGYDDALIRAIHEHEQGARPNTLSVMAIAVRPGRQGEGLSTRVIAALRERALNDGLTHVMAPLRPTLKAQYPLISIDEYATWAREDGFHIDPWIRTHQRMGAKIIATAPASMIIEGSVAEWESWTQMLFPRSGLYVVPGALDVVVIDRERDLGRHVEPNIWVQHF